MKQLLQDELLLINGGYNGWKIAGGVLTIVGSVGGGIASGGTGFILAGVGAASGIAMIGDGLND